MLLSVKTKVNRIQRYTLFAQVPPMIIEPALWVVQPSGVMAKVPLTVLESRGSTEVRHLSLRQMWTRPWCWHAGMAECCQYGVSHRLEIPHHYYQLSTATRSMHSNVV